MIHCQAVQPDQRGEVRHRHTKWTSLNGGSEGWPIASPKSFWHEQMPTETTCTHLLIADSLWSVQEVKSRAYARVHWLATNMNPRLMQIDDNKASGLRLASHNHDRKNEQEYTDMKAAHQAHAKDVGRGR